MLWGSLAIVLAGYAAVGALLARFSVPLWIWTLTWAWAWALAEAVAVAVARALIVAGALTVAVALAWTGAGAIAGAIAVVVAVLVALAWTGAENKLSEFFSLSHTFLILAGTSLAGWGLGWLIVAVLRSFSVLPG